MWKSIVPSGKRTHDLKVDALPTESQLQMITLAVIAESDQYAAMRFAANKNVALSASTIAA